MERFDYLVVGAGTAGCILAARLAEMPGVRVGLIEAGPPDRHPFIHIPVGMVGLINHPVLSWNYLSQPQPALADRQVPIPRGRMLGGSGGLNGMVYTRGHRLDYDDWRAAGNLGWGYDDVLPYFRKSEANLDFSDKFHGREGPVRVATVRRPNRLTQDFLRSAAAQGLPQNHDINGAEQDGFGLRQVTLSGGRRVTSATAFLRQRPANLTVFTGSEVDRVDIRDGRASGVLLTQDGKPRLIKAEREVILCAGTYGSPAILMRSGIGPGTELTALGIDVRHHLPEVGANLTDHPSSQVVWSEKGAISYGLSLRSSARMVLTGLDYLFRRKGMLASNIFEAAGYVRTRPDLDRPDIQIVFCPASRKPGGTFGVGHGFALGVVGLHPRSKGSVKLASRLAKIAPRIDLGLLSDPADLETMLRGLKLARELARTAPLAQHGRDELVPGPARQSDDDMREFLRSSLATAFHPVGTCRMGADAASVVDPELRLRGVSGLRIADASIMPSIVGGNTNAPVMMIAEKAADLVRSASK